MEILSTLLAWLFALPYAPIVVPGVILLALGLFFLLGSKAAENVTALPSGARVVASDTGQNRVKLYKSERLKLSGKPDFVIEEKEGWFRKRKLVPVEVKSWVRYRLHPSQKIQLLVYIALMKEAHGSAVADYGYVIYKDRRYRVDWNETEVRWLEQTVQEARDFKRAVMAEMAGR